MVDVAQLGIALAAKHGDMGPLVELLRSGKPLDKMVRDYLADELEKEPAKRFRRQSKRDLAAAKRDRELFMMMNHIRWLEQREMSDADALDWLAERGIEISPDDVGNAKKRRKSAKK